MLEDDAPAQYYTPLRLFRSPARPSAPRQGLLYPLSAQHGISDCHDDQAACTLLFSKRLYHRLWRPFPWQGVLAHFVSRIRRLRKGKDLRPDALYAG
jgi:hypothetical protein